jgi:hypothetical protein
MFKRRAVVLQTPKMPVRQFTGADSFASDENLPTQHPTALWSVVTGGSVLIAAGVSGANGESESESRNTTRQKPNPKK